MLVAQQGLLGHIILKTSDMTLKQAYAQTMEWLYLACIALSGTALVLITLMIPYGVFMRYAMNNPQSWPEPASVVMMVFFFLRGRGSDLPCQCPHCGGVLAQCGIAAQEKVDARRG